MRPDGVARGQGGSHGCTGKRDGQAVDARTAHLKVRASGTSWPGQAASRPAVEIAHLRKTYGAAGRGRRRVVLGGRGRDLRHPRPERGGEDHHRRVRHRAPVARLGDDPAAGPGPARRRDKIHEIVGVQLQASALPAKLKVGEILDMYRSFYRRAGRRRRAASRCSGSPGSARITTSPCQAASGSGCPSRWRSSAGRRSRCSTR